MFYINGLKWVIKFVHPDSHLLFRADGSQTIGMCDNNTKTIYINEELYGRLLRKVICHELVHAALFSYQVSLTLDQEEIIADLIATYGHEIIAITDKVFSKLA